MTPMTVPYNERVFTQEHWRTDITSPQEELFNCYGAALHKKESKCRNRNSTFAQSLNSNNKTQAENLELITFLDEWFSDPDDLGEEFWENFTRDLKENRFTI